MKMVAITGERWVPGASSERVEADHLARYEFASRYTSGLRVLDIACGAGLGSRMLKDAGALSVDGVDSCADTVRYACEYYARRGVRFVVGRIEGFGSAEAYDLVTCFETIEHTQCFEAALANLARVLKPSGQLLISTPNRRVTSPEARSIADAPRNRFHVREFLASELITALRDAGFCVRQFDTFGQRPRLQLPHRALQEQYIRRCAPDERASSAVRRYWLRDYRYVVILATRIR
jgi:O-antigen biosynthesis protein